LSLLLGTYQRYAYLTPNERYAAYLAIEKHLKEFCTKQNIAFSDIVCRKDVIFDIIDRVDMRRVYFHVFHNKMMSERNAISHFCFWIIKLAPLFNSKNHSYYINAFFAMYLFLNMLKRVGLAINKGKRVIIDQNFAHNVVYAFIYRDVSKEAIMALADAVLVGPQ
jgi:hypothetical protein